MHSNEVSWFWRGRRWSGLRGLRGSCTHRDVGIRELALLRRRVLPPLLRTQTRSGWGGGGWSSGYSEHWPRRPSGARLKRTPPRLWPPSGGSPLAPRTTKNKLVPDVLRKAYRTEPEVKPSILFALKYP